MNDLLHLDNKITHRGAPGGFGPPRLRANGYVESGQVVNLIKSLKECKKFWDDVAYNITPLISVEYIEVVAKSNRVARLLNGNEDKNNRCVVGVKFVGDYGSQRHLITYKVSDNNIQKSIDDLEDLLLIINNSFAGRVDNHVLKSIKANDKRIGRFSKTKFGHLVLDCYFIKDIYVECFESVKDGPALVTMYDAEYSPKELFTELGITYSSDNLYEGNTYLLNQRDQRVLVSKVPYLVSMSLTNLSDIDLGVVNNVNFEPISIKSPGNEPTIGVIDTGFDTSAYFSDWVEYHNMLPEELELTKNDLEHGTRVSSIIVDGPTLNPDLDDKCGHFKVRHFCVSKGDRANAHSIGMYINDIVRSNLDIKVWNLSLGSALEVNINFMTPISYLLDKLQREFDVIFVVAGTNSNNKNYSRLGAPADSINSLVVNSVDSNKKPASYTRVGPILQFYNKPDVSYYGGTISNPIHAWGVFGKCNISGTSVAAPWIARKLCYLIEVMRLSKEVAKALIIDSAAGWKTPTNAHEVGFGVVPIDINNVIHSNKHEIKFFVSGVMTNYESYSYELPVPVYKNTFPYVSKAVLCYTPKCSISQGVDYTDEEISIHFGRIKIDNEGKAKIESIDNNVQDDDQFQYLKEERVRREYRKWDNVKFLNEGLVTAKGNKPKARQLLNSPYWGFSLVVKERLNDINRHVPYGVVVTLSEIDKANRIDSFIQQCIGHGWSVDKIEVDNRIQVYEQAEHTVAFE